MGTECKYCFNSINNSKYKFVVGGNSFTVYKQYICKNCGKRNLIPLNVTIKINNSHTICPFCFSNNTYLKYNSIFIDKEQEFIHYKIRCRKCNKTKTKKEKIIESENFLIEGNKIEEL